MKFNPVRLGTKGTNVYVLQSLLRALQYRGADNKPIQITGTCDANTVYAINTFQSTQRAYGYECGSNGKNDGSFGAKCWNRILGV